jgi:hypothetical protein
VSEITFEGGFFDDAEIDANDVADDPFGFGNDFWPVRIIECGQPKVTNSADKIGMMIKWAVEHPKYDGHQVSKQLGLGNWMRLPVPVALRPRIPFDPKSDPKDQQVLTDLKELYKALGIPADQMNKQNERTLVGKKCLVKIKPKKNEEGFWQFNLFAYKSIPEGSPDGVTEFMPKASGSSDEDLLKAELNGD